MTDTNSAAALDLAPILARVNAAEPGPWRIVEDHGRDITDEGWSLITVQSEAGDRPEVAEMISDEVASASELPLENAEFIAHARTDVLNMAAEIERLRAEVKQYSGAVHHMLALAPDEYRQTIVAARAAGSNGDYAKNNGRAEMIRVFATGLAERASLPGIDWEQIKRDVPIDGVYRTEVKA